MGQRSEEVNDSQAAADNVLENILNEVNRSISERADSCFDSFESFKLQTFGSEDILDYRCSRKENFGKSKDYENQESLSANGHVTDICYPSLANLPEVCIHSSSVSSTCKQGEGDYQQPTIREAVTFYHLNMDMDSRCGSRPTSAAETVLDDVTKDNDGFTVHGMRLDAEAAENIADGSREHNSCASSAITETSYNGIIECLQKEINNLSFDNIQLSDSEDGSQVPVECQGPKTCLEACFHAAGEKCVCLLNNQENCESGQDPQCSGSLADHEVDLQESKKFCQFGNMQYLPHQRVPTDYCQLVDESYGKYDLIEKEEDEQELISDCSSEELVIIESEDLDSFTADDYYSQTYPFKETFMCSANPSTMVLDQFSGCTHGNSEKPQICSNKSNTMTVVADVEPTKNNNNWEEALEVQVNVTEPTKGTDSEDNEGDKRVKLRKYWSNIGLITEKIVDPKCAAFVKDDGMGIESIPGIRKVKEKYLEHGVEGLSSGRNGQNLFLTFKKCKPNGARNSYLQHRKRCFGDGNGQGVEEESINKDNSPESDLNKIDDDEIVRFEDSVSNEEKWDYLNFSETDEKEKRKSTLIARITRSFTNLFKSKQKKPKS